MRSLRCARCALHETRGLTTVPANQDGPAERIRVLDGIARTPTPAQRTITIYRGGTAERSQLPAGHYDCDLCGEPIRPGEPATTITAWIIRPDHEPPFWEPEYIDPLRDHDATAEKEPT